MSISLLTIEAGVNDTDYAIKHFKNNLEHYSLKNIEYDVENKVQYLKIESTTEATRFNSSNNKFQYIEVVRDDSLGVFNTEVRGNYEGDWLFDIALCILDVFAYVLDEPDYYPMDVIDLESEI